MTPSNVTDIDDASLPFVCPWCPCAFYALDDLALHSAAEHPDAAPTLADAAKVIDVLTAPAQFTPTSLITTSARCPFFGESCNTDDEFLTHITAAHPGFSAQIIADESEAR